MTTEPMPAHPPIDPMVSNNSCFQGRSCGDGLFNNNQAVVECPNDTCSGFGKDANGNTAFAQFYAFAGGTTGYFNPSDINQGVNEWGGAIYSDVNFQNLMRMVYNTALNDQFYRLSANLPGATLLKDGAQINGGHFNFVCKAECPLPGRYANGVHVEPDGLIHDDTLSPWQTIPGFRFPLDIGSTLEHGFIDLFGGTVFNHVFSQ